MERLTGWDGEYPYLLKCFEGDGCEDMETTKCNLCEHNIAIFDRLAAYEDTGLMPEDVELYVKCQAQSVSKRELKLSRDIERLQDKLTASQLREQAAVEALNKIRRDINEPDKIYIHVADFLGKWGGTQEARKGDTNADTNQK